MSQGLYQAGAEEDKREEAVRRHPWNSMWWAGGVGGPLGSAPGPGVPLPTRGRGSLEKARGPGRLGGPQGEEAGPQQERNRESATGVKSLKHMIQSPMTSQLYFHLDNPKCSKE